MPVCLCLAHTVANRASVSCWSFCVRAVPTPRLVISESTLGSALFGDKYIAKATPIYVDNKGARDDAYNKTGKRTRHINMRFHRVREAVTKDSIVVQRVTGGNDPATSEMVADILTKSTPAPLFIAMMKIMSGIRK